MCKKLLITANDGVKTDSMQLVNVVHFRLVRFPCAYYSLHPYGLMKAF